MTKRKTTLVREVEPGIGLYRYNPEDENEEGQLRYMPGNPQGRQPGGAVSLHPWMQPITTTERAKELSERGQEKKRQAIEEGIKEAVEEGRGVSLAAPSDALKYIAKAQTALAISGEGMPSVKASELLFKAVDALPDPRYQLQAQAVKIELHIDGAHMAAFEKQVEILDGEYTD